MRFPLSRKILSGRRPTCWDVVSSEKKKKRRENTTSKSFEVSEIADNIIWHFRTVVFPERQELSSTRGDLFWIRENGFPMISYTVDKIGHCYCWIREYFETNGLIIESLPTQINIFVNIICTQRVIYKYTTYI